MAQLARKSIVIETDYSLSRDEWVAQEKAQLESAATAARAKAPGGTVGGLLRWQRADGHAVYMVTSERPLKIAHVEVGDGWNIEPALIRGLRLAEVQAMLESERKMQSLFG